MKARTQPPHHRRSSHQGMVYPLNPIEQNISLSTQFP
jgi:hypothetical protein